MNLGLNLQLRSGVFLASESDIPGNLIVPHSCVQRNVIIEGPDIGGSLRQPVVEVSGVSRTILPDCLLLGRVRFTSSVKRVLRTLRGDVPHGLILENVLIGNSTSCRWHDVDFIPNPDILDISSVRWVDRADHIGRHPLDSHSGDHVLLPISVDIGLDPSWGTIEGQNTRGARGIRLIPLKSVSLVYIGSSILTLNSDDV